MGAILAKRRPMKPKKIRGRIKRFLVEPKLEDPRAFWKKLGLQDAGVCLPNVNIARRRFHEVVKDKTKNEKQKTRTLGVLAREDDIKGPTLTVASMLTVVLTINNRFLLAAVLLCFTYGISLMARGTADTFYSSRRKELFRGIREELNKRTNDIMRRSKIEE